MMHTTLDLDDDVLAAARAQARRLGRPADEVISDLLRRALGLPAVRLGVAESAASHGFQPLPSRGGRVTNELIDALRDRGEG